MKTSGLFTTHRVEVEAALNEPFKIIPFGDVHRDSPMHAGSHWKNFLASAKSEPNALFLGMGDYTDGVSTSERIVLGSPHLHDSTKDNLKDAYKGHARTLADELSFMKGRLIGLLGGNHFFDFGDGTTTDHVLADRLGTRYLGVCSFIRLHLRFRGTRRKSATLDIFAHHGKGGGTLPGSTFNTIEKMQNTADADLYLMGHDHKKGAIPSHPRLRLVGGSRGAPPVVRERTPWLGRTGSFLKAYEPGRVSYAVDAGYPACALGWIEFQITPRRRDTKDGDFIEFDVRGIS